ncbi:MAG: hypothetical protein ABSC07_19375 [Terriglobales bacterium]
MTTYKMVVDISAGAGNCIVQQVPVTDVDLAQAAIDAEAEAAMAAIPPLPTLAEQVAALWAQVVNNDSTQTATLTARINAFNAATTATSSGAPTSTTGPTTTNTVAPIVTTSS